MLDQEKLLERFREIASLARQINQKMCGIRLSKDLALDGHLKGSAIDLEKNMTEIFYATGLELEKTKTEGDKFDDAMKEADDQERVENKMISDLFVGMVKTISSGAKEHSEKTIDKLVDEMFADEIGAEASGVKAIIKRIEATSSLDDKEKKLVELILKSKFSDIVLKRTIKKMNDLSKK
jgi:hypothetical protein